MTRPEKPLVVIPGDDPPQLQGSPQLERLAEVARIELYCDCPASTEEQVERVQGATAVINSRGQVKWPADVLRQLLDLRMISTSSIGTDSIDLKAAQELGIVVSNIPGKTAAIVAEHAFALMLAVARRTSYLTAEMKAGRWPRLMSTSLRGKTLGVIGTGNIGCQMIDMAKRFGMNVIAWSFNPSEKIAEQFSFRYADFNEVLSNSDVVSLHVQLTKQTRGLIGSEQLESMRPGTLLVNTSRGKVVDSAALADALKSGHLGGAALDVFETEPIQADDPILACEQVVLTPHCADQVPEGVELLNSGSVDNVLAFLEGKPRHQVTC